MNKGNVKTLRLGYGNVSLLYNSSYEKFPTITIGEFRDKAEDRVVGRDCLGEPTIDYLALEFPNRESIDVLRYYLDRVEKYMEAEEDCLEMYSNLSYTLDLMERD